MTEPERPAGTPPAASGPTPEEISARLEALLKRTHALRVEKAASPNPLGMTWPPPGRELDHLDVVDVPLDERLHMPADVAPAPAPPSLPVAPTAGEDLPPPAAPQSRAVFDRPDWSELRLRGAQDEPRPGRRGLLLLTLVLAVATLGQAAYIWSTRAAPATLAQLRVEGAAGADVRVDGRAIGVAPLEHELEPGDHDVEIVQASGAVVARRLTLGQGRTLLVVPDVPAGATRLEANAPAPALPGANGSPAAAASPTASVGTSPQPAATGPGAAVRTPPVGAAGAVSATRGAVVIESTPAGLPVTMEGRERGVTPITIGQLRPGRHDVLVGGLAQKVDVSANTVTTLRVARP